MIETLDIIDLLPYELRDRLCADEFFCDIPVVVAEDGNLKAELAKRQAVITTKTNKRGVSVVVLQVEADDEYQPQFGPLTLFPSFQVVENVELNRDANGTKKSARRVARRIRDIFKNGGVPGLVIAFKPEKPFIQPVNLKKELGDATVAYQVNWRCLEKSSQQQQQTQMPQFVSLAPLPQFTITCPTDRATIFYTLDDSYPAAGNPNAVQYVQDEPIDIPVIPGAGPSSVTVRACAFVPGQIASWVTRETRTAA